MSKLSYSWLDFLEFLGEIEMKIKHFLNRKFYNSISEDDIPKDTFYCYSGCRVYGKKCPYLDYSRINNENFCHYEMKFDFALLNDECKICGISEVDDDE